jgi:hypothetical protein
MLPPEIREQVMVWMRGLVTRGGDDPRLLEGVEVEEGALLNQWAVRVRLRDGRVGEAGVLGDPMFDHRRFQQGFAQACGQAYGQPPPAADPGFARSGLPSDFWWTAATLAQAGAARRWVRALLRAPELSNARVDLFIASLDPPKREELLRRARDGVGVEGF